MYWVSEDNVAGEPGKVLFVILPTIGCYRYRFGKACYMCSYPAQAPKETSQERIFGHFLEALDKIRGKEGRFAVRIFTSGSFFDSAEVGRETRHKIFEAIAELDNVYEVVVETRSELVREEWVRELAKRVEGKHFEVAIGLETANDDVADVSINKGNTFEDFVRASERIRGAGAFVKTYLLFKPAFLGEKDAIEDIKASIERAAPYTDTFSINLTNIQKGTIYERLWDRNEYRPPWLWSVIEVLKWAKEKFPEKRFLCDPVGAGSPRGPHNCGLCDREVARAIRRFSTTQDVKHLDIEHECMREWAYITATGLLDWQLITW
ncbi:archaeosine biosynthesis radical SAM protein RaSEA [Pyrococcus yayanosii]|uniref:Predicted Fe-S oxidoreductase n=1 Tax=Pyrococcus yayanosii (strain CH1 / JCM 16557) TaxID=529709 RepID=F8AFC2_PYRYC|nr:archaeosine biosynthesis radical SAM protein RaSEA [Pyrococcus yayanosii]AEH24955.1 Predicted Fe-S oxidoreductase [Pyrococcus yayanosii CH1]